MRSETKTLSSKNKNLYQSYDYLIIGGGIFGVYTALYLAEKRNKILLCDIGSDLLKRASIVNQARLHFGYHYPRSVATARQANEYKERFISDHSRFINSEFKQYYAIANNGSFTSDDDFLRFCDLIDIPIKQVELKTLFNHNELKNDYRTDEISFDPVMISEFYREKINNNNRIDQKMNTYVSSVYKNNNEWYITLITLGKEKVLIKTPSVINATYSGLNGVNDIFDGDKLDLIHEISEIALIHSDKLKNIGLTVMDGSFCSTMPYGLSNLNSLSSVRYTHHIRAKGNSPEFGCQKLSDECNPNHLYNCNICPVKPKSNYIKMIKQLKRYISNKVDIHYIFSLFGIKTTLKSSYIDDSRQTIIKKSASNPNYFSLIAGKINSIYAIEKVLSNE